jgi:hypothetical protein
MCIYIYQIRSFSEAAEESRQELKDRELRLQDPVCGRVNFSTDQLLEIGAIRSVETNWWIVVDEYGLRWNS